MLLIFGLGFGLSAIRDFAPDGRLEHTVILAAKLLAMVAVSAWLFTRLGYSWRELLGLLSLDASRNRRLLRALLIMAALLLLLQFTIGRGPGSIAALGVEWDWALWQIWLLAPLTLLWMTLEAGLTEEFLFRVLLQTRLAAWLSSETAGVLWARTRSLLLLVLLHGWTDLVPNLAPFVRTWLG